MTSESAKSAITKRDSVDVRATMAGISWCVMVRDANSSPMPDDERERGRPGARRTSVCDGVQQLGAGSLRGQHSPVKLRTQ